MSTIDRAEYAAELKNHDDFDRFLRWHGSHGGNLRCPDRRRYDRRPQNRRLKNPHIYQADRRRVQEKLRRSQVQRP